MRFAQASALAANPRPVFQYEAPCSAEIRQRVEVDGKAFARKGRRLRIQGVTYGPFAGTTPADHFPVPERVADNFLRMRAAQINSIRTYHIPPEWLPELASQHGLNVFIDVPWHKHLCFLDSEQARREARQAVAQAAQLGRRHPCILAYSIANEIAPDIVRWYGCKRRAALSRRVDGCRQAGRSRRTGDVRQFPSHRVPRPFVPRFHHLQRLPPRSRGLPPLYLPAAKLDRGQASAPR